jgi:hypothetical protein
VIWVSSESDVAPDSVGLQRNPSVSHRTILDQIMQIRECSPSDDSCDEPDCSCGSGSKVVIWVSSESDVAPDSVGSPLMGCPSPEENCVQAVPKLHLNTALPASDMAAPHTTMDSPTLGLPQGVNALQQPGLRLRIKSSDMGIVGV